MRIAIVLLLALSMAGCAIVYCPPFQPAAYCRSVP